MKKTSLFKQYLLGEEILMIPVSHDPLCATIIQRAGFRSWAAVDMQTRPP